MPLDHPIEFILLLKSMNHISVQRLIRSTQKSTIFSVASARKVWLIQVQVNCLDNHLSWPEGVQYSLIYLHSHIHQLAKNLWTWLFPASTSPLSSETEEYRRGLIRGKSVQQVSQWKGLDQSTRASMPLYTYRPQTTPIANDCCWQCDSRSWGEWSISASPCL